MRDVPINSQRPASADDNSVADLSNQLYRAYLSGDGAAVERIMAQINGESAAEPTRTDNLTV
jgi:hypothetical protein